MKATLLYAWKAGALDPPDQLRVEEALRADPMLLARALALEEPTATVPADPWRLPPGGWGLQSRVLQAQVFGGRLRPGDRFRIALKVPDAEARAVVVLRRHTAWEVVFPTDANLLRASELPLEGQERVLDLTAGPEAGQQIWGVALPTMDGIEPRWARLQQQIAAGAIPVTQVRIEVASLG